MFHSLTGTLTGKGPEAVFLTTGGIEWELAVSMNTVQSLPPVGSDVRVFVWLHHSEDQMRLYGFSTLLEKRIFLELIRVDGIGPRAAIKILSGLSPDRLTAALEGGDLQTLSKAPGVGLKTAQKILLALRGKLSHEEEPLGVPSGWQDLVASLTAMGFERRKVEQALQAVGQDADLSGLSPQDRERELFRRALVWLSTT